MDQATARNYPMSPPAIDDPVSQQPRLDEQHAVAACRDGDHSAFRLIVERYGDLMTGTAYLMLGDRGRAEDAAQDALLDAWRGLDRFDAGRPLRPWLLRLVINRALQQRRRKLFGLLPLRESTFQIPALDPLPGEVVERNAEREAVRQALGRLDPDAARIVVLRYFAEMTVAEIAEALAIPEGTVKSRLHRARRQLRDEFARDGFLGEE